MNSLLVTFNEVINDLGPDLFSVDINGVTQYNQYTDINNLYTSPLNVGDTVRIDFTYQGGTGGDYTAYRKDYTNDNEGGDFGIKSTLISSGVTTGTTLSVSFTATTIPASYRFNYEVNFQGFPILPVVYTYAATSVTFSGATLNGRTEELAGSEPIIERGFIYGLDPTLTTGNTIVQVTGSTGNYSYNATNLIPFAVYYYKAYAVNSLGSEYGQIFTFSTSALDVDTNVLTGFTSSSMTVGGSVSPAYLTQIAEQGVFYSITSGVTTSSIKSVSPNAISNSWSYTLSGLNDVTTYYVRAFVRYNNGEYSLGELVSGATLGNPPTVETLTSSGATYTVVYFNGDVTSAGSNTVTSRGYQYANNMDFTGSTIVTVTGTTGEYTKEITGLTPGSTYYYKSFATNSWGTSYGEVQTGYVFDGFTIRWQRVVGSSSYCSCCTGTGGSVITFRFRVNGGAWTNASGTYQYTLGEYVEFDLCSSTALNQAIFVRSVYDLDGFFSSSCTGRFTIGAGTSTCYSTLTGFTPFINCTNAASCGVDPNYEYTVLAATCRGSCAGFGCSNNLTC